MNRFIIILMLLSSALGAVTIGPWQNLTFSGRTAANQAYLRTDLNYAGIDVNKIIYSNGTGMTETDLAPQNSGTHTYQGAFPVSTARRYLGLRLHVAGFDQNIIPVYHESTALPALSQLTRVAADPQNDTGYQNLDIVSDYLTFNGSGTGLKISAAIQNRGGGFPTSAGLGTTYYSYMSVIAPPGSDPNDPGVVVWALVYMNVPLGGISPGLFRIEGTATDDLIRIGDITYNIDTTNNLLVMSCNVSDLLADPAFAAWYNVPAPAFGFASLTTRTTVIPFATYNEDQTSGGKMHLRPLFFDPSPNQAPLLTDPQFAQSGSEVWFGVTYSDPDQNFPLTAQVTLGRNQVFDLHPQSTDYSLPVLLRTENIYSLINEYNDTEAVFTCSDNNTDYSNARLDFFYIRGLSAPEGVFCNASAGGVQLNWEPVTRTLEGTSVDVSLYRIWSASDPYAPVYTPLGTTPSTSYSIPAGQASPMEFLRITAEK